MAHAAAEKTAGRRALIFFEKFTIRGSSTILAAVKNAVYMRSMKMKNLSAMVVLAALLFSLASCSGNDTVEIAQAQPELEILPRGEAAAAETPVYMTSFSATLPSTGRPIPCPALSASSRTMKTWISGGSIRRTE
jgi:hypothetical protein